MFVFCQHIFELFAILLLKLVYHYIDSSNSWRSWAPPYMSNAPTPPVFSNYWIVSLEEGCVGKVMIRTAETEFLLCAHMCIIWNVQFVVTCMFVSLRIPAMSGMRESYLPIPAKMSEVVDIVCLFCMSEGVESCTNAGETSYIDSGMG